MTTMGSARGGSERPTARIAAVRTLSSAGARKEHVLLRELTRVAQVAHAAEKRPVAAMIAPTVGVPALAVPANLALQVSAGRQLMRDDAALVLALFRTASHRIAPSGPTPQRHVAIRRAQHKWRATPIHTGFTRQGALTRASDTTGSASDGHRQWPRRGAPYCPRA